jgi:transposase-like protein
VEAYLNQLLEEQMGDHLGADRHERTTERPGYRNGTRERRLFTRVGPITLRVPQARDGGFRRTFSSATSGASRLWCWRS